MIALTKKQKLRLHNLEKRKKRAEAREDWTLANDLDVRIENLQWLDPQDGNEPFLPAWEIKEEILDFALV